MDRHLVHLLKLQLCNLSTFLLLFCLSILIFMQTTNFMNKTDQSKTFFLFLMATIETFHMIGIFK